MRNHVLIIAILACAKLIIQLVGSRNYGFHRDEILHLSASEHLEWGFMEFPPFIALLGKFSYLLFDYSLVGTRFFPTAAGVGILILCCLIAKEFKGNKLSIIIAGVSILAFLPFYRNHTLFQPVAFDQLFWTLGFYYLVRYLNTENKNFLLLIGVTLGIGLCNKYTILIWALGVFIGMIFYKKGKIFRDKWWYISGCLSLLIISPNIWWQYENDWPVLRHLQGLHNSQLSQLHPMQFALEQLYYPFTLIVSILGLVYLFRTKKYRSIGIASAIIFITMWLLQSKAYYVFALYPVLFAAGAVVISNWLAHRKLFWRYAIVALLLFTSIPFIPHATPVLPIETYVNYAALSNDKGRVELSADYADMFGWIEQVALIDSIYHSFTKEEQKSSVLWAENYGEAGALKILGKKRGLPNPISRHGSFWKWGNGNEKATTWISLGNELAALRVVFEEIELVKIIHHKYAMDEENGIPVYICRKPKLDLNKWWSDYEPYIFD